MFKWPGLPSPSAPVHELADFAELVCWQEGNTSVVALTQALGRLEENDYTDGVIEEDELPKDNKRHLMRSKIGQWLVVVAIHLLLETQELPSTQHKSTRLKFT